MKNWHYENLKIGLSQGIEGTTVYESNRVKIINSPSLGRALYIDGSLQTCEFDEFYYHEMIVHPPMQSHPNPKKILIVGGGDGGTLREVLKYDCVRSVDVVDINPDIAKVSKDYLKFTGIEESFKDQRTSYWVDCGYRFLKHPMNSGYDVIIVDCGDPNFESDILYSMEFVSLCCESLNADGIVNFQSQYYIGSEDFVKHFRLVCDAIFNFVHYYHCPVPTYPLGGIGFMTCRKSSFISRYEKSVEHLRYYDANIKASNCVLPKFMTDSLRNKRFNTICSIFNWREFVLGMDLPVIDHFMKKLDGERPFDPMYYPPALLIVGQESGVPYFKLRLSTAVGMKSVSKVLKQSITQRNLQPLDIDGVSLCGAEWDSRDNRKLTLTYGVPYVELVGDVDKMIPAFFPEQFYSRGLIDLESNGHVIANVFSPKGWRRIDANGQFEFYTGVTTVDMNKRLFKSTLDDLECLYDVGMGPYLMSYMDFQNYGVALFF